jgi:acyl-coenzyme A synthetase/AMP-(fatty) acid ligase
MKKQVTLYNDIALTDDAPYAEKTAIIESYSGKTINYAQLTHAIEQMALAMRFTLGLQPGDVIIVVSHKRIEDVILFYGALAAGICYVPADPKLGKEKFNYLLEHIQPQKVFDTVPGGEGVLVEYRDGLLHLDGKIVEDFEAVTINYEAYDTSKPAYIIYTSGSGGLPKGVQMPRIAPVLFAQNLDTYGYVNDETVYISVCPFYFDATIVDLFVVLPHHGQIVLTPDIVFPADMLEPMEKYKITDGFWVPSMFKIMLSRFSDIDKRDLSSIKMIWFGGEYCPFPLWKSLAERIPGKKYLNVYGPTEITHSCILHHFDETYDFSVKEEIPLGTPSHGTRIFVLNEDMEEVKPGETGEVYVESDTIMIGYYNNPERSSKVMVNIPSLSPKTLYKTGDLVLYTETGNYYFRSRVDDLVKVGGILISLDEIEKAVLRSGMVKECVLSAVTLPGGTDVLVAFIRPKEGFRQTDLHQFLRQNLEPGKVPRYFEISEDEFELTRNGKVNKKWLVENFIRKHETEMTLNK